MPLLRWPGGCYADHYHWRDGVGPAEQRPVRLGMSCGLQVEDDNSLGTHEFLRLCGEIGAEPYLAGNVGSGTPQELADWLEYCNTALGTTLGRERRANGASDPFGVRLWGVGKVTAQRILQYRSKRGRFRDVREVMNIQGIGEKKFKEMAQYLRLN